MIEKERLELLKRLQQDLMKEGKGQNDMDKKLLSGMLYLFLLCLANDRIIDLGVKLYTVVDDILKGVQQEVKQQGKATKKVLFYVNGPKEIQ